MSSQWRSGMTYNQLVLILKYRKGLSTVMKAKSDQLEVKLLLFAIKKTTAFEKFLAQRFISSTYIASLVPKRFKPNEENEVEEEQESVNKVTQDSSRFLGMVSRCFEPHLNVYIESQDKNLFDLMASFVTDTKSAAQSKKGEGVVAFPSAADLFIYFLKCLVQCSSLSTGHPLLNLTEIFQKYLREYATKILEGSLPNWIFIIIQDILWSCVCTKLKMIQLTF